MAELADGLVRPRRALVIGGARSGKSDFALRLAASYGEPVLFVATAIVGDAEMAVRVDAHRRARPPGWPTVEAPTGVGAAIGPRLHEVRTVLLDCLSLLAANCLMAQLPTPTSAAVPANTGPVARDPRRRRRPRRAPLRTRSQADQAVRTGAPRVEAEVCALLDVAGVAGCNLVVVTSEVGLGIVPEYPLGRAYRDVLGRANQQLAAAADAVYLLVAGVPVELKRLASTVALDAVPSPPAPPAIPDGDRR